MKDLLDAKFILAVVALALVGGLVFSGKISGGEGMTAILSILSFGAGMAMGKKVPPVAGILLCFALSAGCATSVPAHLERSLEGVRAVNAVALPAFRERCSTAITACANTEPCPPYDACKSMRRSYQKAVAVVLDGLAAINRMLQDAKIIEEVK